MLYIKIIDLVFVSTVVCSILTLTLTYCISESNSTVLGYYCSVVADRDLLYRVNRNLNIFFPCDNLDIYIYQRGIVIFGVSKRSVVVFFVLE